MKRVHYILLFVISFKSYGQAVGIGTNTPNASAILDINSSSKGLLLPRMTTAQRIAIASPTNGLIVYDISTNSFWFYKANTWTDLGTAGSSTISLPLNQSINTVTSGLQINNTGTGSGLAGTATIGNGVFGSANSNGGAGINGIGTNGATAVKATASGGLALDVSGNLQISGGNTNPSVGAVLTSDANGNAVWKSNRVAFSATGIHSSYRNIIASTQGRLQFGSEEYDFGNNYKAVGDDASPFNTSEFTAPVTGLYHFDLRVTPELYDYGQSTTVGVNAITISLWLLRNGTYTEIAEVIENHPLGIESNWRMKQFMLSKDIRLQAGDKIHAQILQTNDAGRSISFYNNNINNPIIIHNSFAGHLVFAE